MNYWILMFRPDTYEQVKEKSTIGVLANHRKRFAALSPGDKFVAYVSRVSELDSYGEIVGEPCQDATPIFPGWERYEHRCAVKFDRIGARLPAKDLLFELSPFRGELKTLPTNLLFCKGGFMEITKDDYDRFRRLVDEQTRRMTSSGKPVGPAE